MYHHCIISGHNNQCDEWTFDGTLEVTVNLFTLYVHYKFTGQNIDSSAHENVMKRKQIMQDFFNNGPDFETWKEDPFVGLIMYMQVIEKFGWEPIKSLFKEYLQLSDNERPEDDDDRRDQWMVRLSKMVKYNLAPFFDKWTVPISDKARKQVAKLPVWMPAELAKM